CARCKQAAEGDRFVGCPGGNIMKIRNGFALVIFAANCSIAQTVAADAEIRKILADRIDAQKQSVGIVAGVVEPAGRRIVAYGSLNQGDQRTLDGDTVFEIGSITKVFTSLLLAEMVQRGEVALTDPVAKFLPPGNQV